MSSPAQDRASRWLALALVCLATAWVYRHVPGFEFVMWDDDIELYRNPALRPLAWSSLLGMLTDSQQTRSYAPLGWIVRSALVRAFGMNPAAFHALGLLLHVANAALAFGLLRALLRTAFASRPGPGEVAQSVCAALGALLWALHPMRVETVAWATAGRYGQAAFFCLLALLLYARATALRATPAYGRPAYWGSVAATAAAVFSYGIALPLPLVLVALDHYPLRRLATDDGPWWRRYRALAVEKLPFLLAPALAGPLTLWARLQGNAYWAPAKSLDEFGLLPRVMQGFYVWAYYVWKPFVPLHLQPLDTRLVEFDPFEPDFLLSAGLVLLATLAAVALRRRLPALAVAWFCHLALLAPLLGLSEHPYYVTDRYSYLVGLAGAALLAGGLAGLWASPARRREAWAASLGAGALTLWLGALSVPQTLTWRNSEALFRHMIAEMGQTPHRGVAYRGLGVVYLEQGRDAEALACLQHALALRPYDTLAAALLLGLQQKHAPPLPATAPTETR